MYRVIETYERVKLTGSYIVVCPECGRKRRHKKTFYETINPFNVNDDGTSKTRHDIMMSLNKKANEYVPTKSWDIYHRNCWWRKFHGEM